ncbi:MAG: endonuclease/exonuclease/phosphatase family protein [Desulforegulaceae bacterium]|nr:endonuclease/exonuclease/phosphatase family protein [Desulforegulaceae bacterium]
MAKNQKINNFKIFYFFIFLSLSSFCNAQSLSIMTWNTGDSDRSLPKASEIQALINKNGQNPDILIIQEIFYNNYSSLKKRLDYKHGIHSAQISQNLKNLAILSSFELSGHELIVFSKNISGALKTEVEMPDKKKLKVYCVHFEYIKNKSRDNNGYVSLSFKDIIEILAKEVSCENPRKHEAEKLIEKAGKPGQRTIIAGDFNTVSFSSSVRTIKKFYSDAAPIFKRLSSGTYKKISFPIKPRIDYIFHSPDIKIEAFKIIKETPGDHYPVTAKIKVLN